MIASGSLKEQIKAQFLAMVLDGSRPRHIYWDDVFVRPGWGLVPEKFRVVLLAGLYNRMESRDPKRGHWQTGRV